MMFGHVSKNLLRILLESFGCRKVHLQTPIPSYIRQLLKPWWKDVEIPHQTIEFGCFIWNPDALWCWYIYLQNWVIFGVNVGTYSSTMEHMGTDIISWQLWTIIPNLSMTRCWPIHKREFTIRNVIQWNAGWLKTGLPESSSDRGFEHCSLFLLIFFWLELRMLAYSSPVFLG